MLRRSRRVAVTLVTPELVTQIRSFRLPSLFSKLSWRKSSSTLPITYDDNRIKDSKSNINFAYSDSNTNNTDQEKEVACQSSNKKIELSLREKLAEANYLEERGVHIEEIAGGVQVINLPCKTKEKTEFDEYMTSTSEYRMRTVSPHSTDTAKVDALGAGFGMLDDKRLSYLRPRDGATSQAWEQQKEKEKQRLQQSVHDEWSLEEQNLHEGENSSKELEKRQNVPSSLNSIQLNDTFAGKMSLFSSLDEHGNPVTFTGLDGKPLQGRALRMERFRQQQQLIRSMSGSTFNRHEHPLLVDLDFAKDAHLYGNTREEFEQNVRKMKKLISTFQRWESTDNMYRYATIALQLMTVFVFTEIVYNYSILQLLANQYDDFVDVIDGELRELEHVRENDLHRVINELKSNPPNFEPVVDAMKREKWRRERELKKVNAEQEEAKRKEKTASANAARERKQSEMPSFDMCNDSTKVSAFTNNDTTEGNSSKKSVAISQLLLQPPQPVLTVHDLVDDNRPHPMGTAHVELYKTKEEQAKTAYELKRSQRITIDERSQEKSAVHRVKHVVEWWSHGTLTVVRAYANRVLRRDGSLMRQAVQTKQGKVESVICSEEEGVTEESAYDTVGSAHERKPWAHDVLSADDKERYSYVATPTGIDTMRAVRRILLPRSEDYTQIVREEMVTYQQEKSRRVGKLQSS